MKGESLNPERFAAAARNTACQRGRVQILDSNARSLSMKRGRQGEFTPEDLRVRGHLTWMQEGDEGHWFAPPSSHGQMVFSEDGVFAHSLTGVRIDVVSFEDCCGYVEQEPWNGTHMSGERFRFSDLVEASELIFATCREGGLEFWSADAASVSAWARSNAVWTDWRSFRAVSRAELQRMLKEARRVYFDRERAQRRSMEGDRLENRRRRAEERAALEAERAAWRSAPAYQRMFTEVYGKPLHELDGSDPANMIWHAHRLIEWRLRLGVWAPLGDSGA